MDVPPRGRFAAVIGPIDVLTAFGGGLASLSLILIFIFIFSEIISRNLLGASLAFSWDFAAYMMGACFMLGAGSALKGGSHVRVTAITEILSPRAGRLLDLGACVAGFIISAYFAYALSSMGWLSYARNSASSSVMRTPLWLPQALLAFGAIILSVQMIAQFLRLLRGEALSSGPGLE
jgi:TRAP-type C4-dicarboxylate transport system permease small subunit